MVVNDHQLVDKVFEDLQKFGINKLTVTNRSRRDVDALRGKLRVAAVKNAKAKAEELAGALGQEIGVAIQIEDYTADADPVMLRSVARNYKVMDGELANMESYVAPDFQKIKLDYRVRVVFVLK